MTQDAIPFWLDRTEAQDGGSLEYRPWGTRSLKIQVKTDKNLAPMRLRLKNVETKPGLVRAFADDSNALMVSWGGGHEENPPVRAKDFLVALEKPAPLKASQTNYVYFNITHVGPDLPDESRLTLSAYPAGGGETLATLTLRLQKPANYPPNVIRMQRVSAAGEPGRWTVSPGGYLPLYDGRWWPAPQVTYEPANVPALTITQQDNRLEVRWPGQTEPIAVLCDQTTPSILDQPDNIAFELFLFFDPARKDSWRLYLALRAWFFWLDTSVGYQGSFFGRHEVPDSERFDMLIRRQDGQVALASTDLHWQEVWGQIVEPPLQATLGLNRQQKIDLGKDKLWRWIKREKDKRPNYNPIGFIYRLAERLATEDEIRGALQARAKGSEAHVPTLNNVQQVKLDAHNDIIEVSQGTRTVHNMTSTDVRLV